MSGSRIRSILPLRSRATGLLSRSVSDTKTARGVFSSQWDEPRPESGCWRGCREFPRHRRASTAEAALDEHAKRLEALRIVTTEITRDLGCPLRRCSRQVRMFEEYNPSRRSRAPSPPGCVHASASRGGGCLIHICTEGCVLSGGREGDLRRPRPCGIPAARFLGSLTSWGLGTGHASAPWEGSGGRTPVARETLR